MTLVPKAPRLVSMVVPLCTMTLSRSFQARPAGSGLAAAGAAACAMAPWLQEARPAAASAVALRVSKWRRGKELGVSIMRVSVSY